MLAGAVLCNVPNAGLGNQLFPLLKSFLFAKKNHRRVIVVGYHQFKIGPYLRGDRTKRKYRGFFVFEDSLLKEKVKKIQLKLTSHKIYNPPINMEVPAGDGATYVFDNIPHWKNYFEDLRNYRTEVVEIFWSIIQSSIKMQLEKFRPPVIGLHMRMGDFKKLEKDVDFNKVGVTRTPEEYFGRLINEIRNVYGADLPVSIFTDGRAHEIEQLLSFPNVELVAGNNDLVDLLLLSKSKLIITSAGSTFSYWAGFLSTAPIIMHPAHIYQPIRLPADGYYEGVLDLDNPDLVRAIKNITL